MKEDYLNRKAKNLRNKLIFFIHSELKKKLKNNHYLLINSMTPKELNNRYQKCSDYCVERIETYSSSQINNGINNNNYYHVSLTYCSLNNNYHMLIDNRNIDQIIGENNIIGKYYQGNDVQIRTTTNKTNNNIKGKEVKLEKMIIGNNKFTKKKRVTYSSLNVSKNILMNYDDKIFLNYHNNNDNNKLVNNLNSNNELNKKIQTNCQKPKNKNIINIYISKLKHYCSSLIIIKRRKEASNIHKNKNSKHLELVSPAKSERKKMLKKEKNYNEKEKKTVIINSNRENYNLRYQTENMSQNKVQNNHSKFKSQIKMKLSLYKIPEKRSFHRKIRTQSIDFSGGKSSPKKNSPTKKHLSPRKLFNSMKPNHSSQISNIIQKNHKKTKINESKVKNTISGVILNKRKMFTANNVHINANYKLTNNVTGALNSFKLTAGTNKKLEKKTFKRANTGINKIYNFKGNEIKFKDY